MKMGTMRYFSHTCNKVRLYCKINIMNVSDDMSITCIEMDANRHVGSNQTQLLLSNKD